MLGTGADCSLVHHIPRRKVNCDNRIDNQVLCGVLAATNLINSGRLDGCSRCRAAAVSDKSSSHLANPFASLPTQTQGRQTFNPPTCKWP
jgi:hypothetical protein